jgi:hypothetical protein
MTLKIVEARIAFRNWLRRLKTVVCFYPRQGRGAVIIFDLDSRRELAKILRDWTNLVNAQFAVYPLQNPVLSQKALKEKFQILNGRK